jgi:Ca2+-binding EF-hand superfamily protein
MSKHERKTALSMIALMVAFGTASWAQQTQPAATQAQPQAQPQAQQTQPAATREPMTLRKLFASADKNGDGKVTKDEAKGTLPITYASFEQVDTDKRGWISFDQFLAFTKKRVNKQADDILHQWDRY